MVNPFDVYHRNYFFPTPAWNIFFTYGLEAARGVFDQYVREELVRTASGVRKGGYAQNDTLHASVMKNIVKDMCKRRHNALLV